MSNRMVHTRANFSHCRSYTSCSALTIQTIFVDFSALFWMASERYAVSKVYILHIIYHSNCKLIPDNHNTYLIQFESLFQIIIFCFGYPSNRLSPNPWESLKSSFSLLRQENMNVIAQRNWTEVLEVTKQHSCWVSHGSSQRKTNTTRNIWGLSLPCDQTRTFIQTGSGKLPLLPNYCEPLLGYWGMHTGQKQKIEASLRIWGQKDNYLEFSKLHISTARDIDPRCKPILQSKTFMKVISSKR